MNLHHSKLSSNVCLLSIAPIMPVSSGASNASHPDGLLYRARSYQLEMLEESLRANIIVAVLGSLYCVYRSMLMKIDGYWKR
jgi:hypothetical protein